MLDAIRTSILPPVLPGPLDELFGNVREVPQTS